MYYDKQAEVIPEAPVKEVEPWRKVLLDAAQYIRDHGWTRGRFRNDEGEVCLVGALRMATYNHPRRGSYCAPKNDPFGIAIRHLMRVLRVPPNSLTQWNDRRCSGRGEVISVLEKAATLPE